jgi:putative aminopeptidase FrvX
LYELVKQLTSLHGPCGFEQSVSKWIRDMLRPFTDEVVVDSLGNVIARKQGNKRRKKKELQRHDFAGEVVAIFTVQEEVGLRGAQVAANHIEADVAIVIDTKAVSDTPEEMMDNSLALGKGTGVKIMDFSLISHPAVKKTYYT